MMIQSALRNLKANLVSYIFVGLGIAFALFSSILYLLTGVTIFVTKLDLLAVILPFVGAAIGLLSFLFGYKMVKFAAFLPCLYAFFSFLRVEITYIVNVFVAIDGNSFTPSFLLTLIALVASTIFFLVGAITQKERLGEKQAEAKEGN